MSTPSAESPRQPYVVRKQAAPLIEVDCSGWGQMLEVAIEVTGQAGAEQQAHNLRVLLEAIDQLDLAQGGSKFRLVAQKVVGATLVLTLAPIEPENAKQRIDAIVGRLGQTVGQQVPVTHAKAA